MNNNTELQADRCELCSTEMETHPVDDTKKICPSCLIDDIAAKREGEQHES